MRLVLTLICFTGWLTACNLAPATSPPPLPDNTGVVVYKDGGDERLRELAIRLLTPYMSYAETAGSIQTPELIVGGLPDDLPFELPLPANSKLLGTTTSTMGWSGSQVFLDSNESPDAVIEFYTQALAAQGFSVWTPPMQPSTSSVGYDGVVLCNLDKQIELSVSTFFVSKLPVQVSLYINTNPQSTSCMTEQFAFTQTFAEKFKPVLITPPEAYTSRHNIIVVGGTSVASSSNKASESIEIYSDQSVQDVAKYYADQIQAAGWTKLDETNTDSVAHSRWTKTDQFDGEWVGVLLVTTGAVDAYSRIVLFSIELK